MVTWNEPTAVALLTITSTDDGAIEDGGVYGIGFDVVVPTVTVTLPCIAPSGMRTCNCVPPAARTGAVTVPPPETVNCTTLFAGVATSKPAPSSTTTSPCAPPPQISTNCNTQFVPAMVTMRALLVWAPTLTVTGPQTAPAGTVTVKLVVVAAVT